ncbi:hypothetical protein KKG71_06545 [Patescibacteria group bacterium]|nr:hypothetical protein [Patescibacteria group bacterium]
MRQTSYLSPLYSLWYSYLFLYCLPAIYTYLYFPEIFRSDNSFIPFLYCNVIYGSTILIVPIFLRYNTSRNQFNFSLFKKANDINNPINRGIIKISLLVFVISIILFLYLGLPKLLLLGKGSVDPWEFRIIGYDDSPKYLVFVLEVLRRILFPFISIYMLTNYHVKNISMNILSSSGFLINMLFSAFFLVSIINLDRGPVLLFISVFAYYHLVIKMEQTFRKRIGNLILFLLVLSFAAAVVSFLQYNNTTFTKLEFFNQSQNILLNRAVLDPVLSSYTLSFGIFGENSSKLYFEYSRLFSIFSGSYTPTVGFTSIYVAPCGIVGDAWRNGGYWGVFFTAIFVSGIYYYLEKNLLEISGSIQIPVSFLALVLALYIIYGGLFSLGPFALILFMFYIIYSNRERNHKKSY